MKLIETRHDGAYFRLALRHIRHWPLPDRENLFDSARIYHDDTKVIFHETRIKMKKMMYWRSGNS